MYTHFEQLKKLLTVVVLFLAGAAASQNTVTVSIAVSPPYSTHISDYTSQPGKIMATILNTSPAGGIQQVYLQGTISSTGGIKVYTDPEFKMPEPITLMPGQAFLVSVNNLGMIFDEDHLIFEGITKQEVIYGNGLPEDDYQICIRAFDYASGRAVSAEEPQGCSGIFSIRDIEPPIILNPICGDSISASVPQNLIFNWTMPPGTPMNTQYYLKMTEILPSDRDPNDAMNSAGHPVFYEKTAFSTSLLYGPAEPALIEGKHYAFSITAIDPLGKTAFRNGGQSEVCSFVYKSGFKWVMQTDVTTIPEHTNNLGNINISPGTYGNVSITPPYFVTMTTITGKLMYEYAENDGKKFPLAGANIRLAVKYLKTGKSKNPLNSPWEFFGPTANFDNIPDDYTLASRQTGNDGDFSFSYLEDMNFGYLSSSSGEFGRDYYRVAMVVVESPQGEFFLSPSEFITPKAGETFNAGTFTAKVKSYEIDITVKPKHSDIEALNLATGTDHLSSISVYLCRKPDFSYQLFPLEDGKLKGQPYKKVDDKIKFKVPGLVVVAKGVTGTDGTISFQRVVWNHNANYTYYLWAESDAESDQNFSFGAPVPFEPYLPYTTNPGIINPVDPADIQFYRGYELQGYAVKKNDLFMDPQLPRVAGKVLEGSPGEAPLPLAGVKVDLGESYQFFDKTDSKTLIAAGFKANESASINACNQDYSCGEFYNNYMTFTPADGSFSFDFLSMLYSNRDQKTVGPLRTLHLSKDGYNDLEVLDIGVLNFGKQAIKNNLMLTKGAMISGRVTDAESGTPLQAYLRFIDGAKSHQCKPNGTFKSIPALLLPNQKQKIIVEMQGYITDTVEFFVDKPSVSLGEINLYTIKRRLKVFVYDSRSLVFNPIPIANADVRILNVTNPGTNSPIGMLSDNDGVSEIAFVNGMDNNTMYEIRVGMLVNTSKNYEQKIFSIKIPVSQHTTNLVAFLNQAACVKGMVYAGANNQSPVGVAKITQSTGRRGSAELNSTSGADGYYYLNNVPVRTYAQTMKASKSQSNFIGDQQLVYITQASDQCITQDFHLSVYNDMDISKLLGFPMEVDKLKEDQGKTLITGSIVQLKGNDQFGVVQNYTKLSFTDVEIKAGTTKNSNGVPIAVPVAQYVKTIQNFLKINVYNQFDGDVSDTTNGIRIEKSTANTSIGIIKGKVRIYSTAFNIKGISMPDIWLANGTAVGETKMNLTVLNADPVIKQPNTVPNGFYACNAKGNPLRYGFTGFSNPAAAEINPLKSYVKPDKLLLSSILHTNCNNVTGGDMKINLGDVEVTKTTFKVNTTAPVSLKLEQWKLDCSSWNLDDNGLTLKNSVIHAGLDIPVDNLVLSYASLLSDKAVVQFSALKILGIQQVTVTSTNKGLSYFDSGNGNMKWQIYASNDGSGEVGNIQGLPGMQGQKLQLELIKLVSDGTRTFAPKSVPVKMFNIVDFIPSMGSSINIYDDGTPPWFKVQGIFSPHIPYIDQFKGNIAYTKNGNTFTFGIDNPELLKFTHYNAQFRFDPNGPKLSDQLFTLKGTVEEPGQLLPVKITLSKTPVVTKTEIDPGQKILITGNGSKYLQEVTGGMLVENNAWNNFWFEGQMVGMKGISENPNRVKFTLTGAITADGQSIKVSNMSDKFPGISLVYDYANSRLSGSFSHELNLGAMHGNCNASILMDGNGWYFDMGGELILPILPGISGGGEFYGLVGDYNNVPPSMSGKYGSFKCLPSSFKNHISGFLLQSGGKVELLSGLHFDFVLASVDVGVDLGAVQRMWMSFDDVGNTYGIALLEYCHIYANGGMELTCTSVSAGMNFEMGASGVYVSNGNYSIDGCATAKFTIRGEQCLGLMGICCGDCCASVDIGDPTIGITLHYDNVNGASLGLTTSECSTQCP